jgi:hypothetical protein
MVTGHKGSDRRTGPKPWVTIAAVAGVLIVVIIAFLVYWGGTDQAGLQPGSAAEGELSGQGISPSAVKSSSGQDGVLTYGVAPSTVYELTPVQVPSDGIFIRTSYIGGYEGSYTTGGDTQAIRNSGERVVEIGDPGPAISITVKKQDGSTGQVLTVELWQDGHLVKSGTTSLPFGEVNINGDIPA